MSNKISQTSTLDVLLKEIYSKTDQMKAVAKSILSDPSNETFITSFNQMTKSIDQILSAISNNIDFLTDSELFKDDFHNSINTINIAINSYIKALESIKNAPENLEDINFIKNNMIYFSQSLNIFSTNFLEIIQKVAELKQSQDHKEEDQTILNTRLGLESSLFNLSVKFDTTSKFPFFKSKFIGVYRCYNTINSINEPIAAIQSFCGTGKTSVIPLILMSRSLKDHFQTPFVILAQPTPRHVENEVKFFNSIISKYVTIITETDKFSELINEYEKNPKNQKKLIFAVLTPHLLLPLLFDLRKNQVFYQSTRIIIDEIHQRAFHLDVLISKIADLDFKFNVFKIPLNVVLMSASIYSKLLNPFNKKVTITSLIKNPQYEVIESPPIMEHFIDKINNEVVRDEVIKVVEEMAKINSKIERGHILCFLNKVKICQNVNSSVLSLLNDNEETEERKKIVFLRTTLKSNESIENFFKRLQKEYTENEEIRKANKSTYKHDFFYVIPLVFSGVAEDAISELALNEFPSELKNITKLICSTPLSESFNYEDLSVVIDSGLVKQPGFDIKTSLTTVVETQASKEAMFQRKGRLGRSMRGLYIPIMVNKEPPEIQIPPIQRLDLTANILLMKDIQTDIEKVTNLPDEPNSENLEFALKNLIRMKAIDEKTSQITPLGHEMLKFPFIPIYYAAAVIQMIEKFPSSDKSNAYFIGAYLSLIISMYNLLVVEDMSENLSRYFNEESDIVTLYEALNFLIKSELEDQQMIDLVESYGFSYSNFLVLKERIQKVADVTHPGKSIKEVVSIIESFKNGIMEMIDLLIKEIEISDPNWGEIHRIKFNKVKGAGGLKRSPTLYFKASNNLKLKKQRTPTAEVSVTKRPGWNGISIPTDCYCFNINRNMVYNTNTGRLIHRVSNGSKSAINSIEVKYTALNPWFNVLLNCYLNSEDLKVTRFQNDDSKSEGQIIHMSNVGGRVFISFISSYETDLIKIKNAINQCFRILPYSPNGVLIYRSDLKTLFGVRLIGTEIYDVTCAEAFHADVLNKELIDFCVENISKLQKSEPELLICSLFIKETCKLNEYIQNKLFLINNKNGQLPILLSLVEAEIESVKQKAIELKRSKIGPKGEIQKKQEVNFFEFPPRFIHPSLLHHPKSLECIMNWFSKHCNYAHVVRVIGHRILMKTTEIRQLQIHIQKEGNKIKKEMNLNYKAIPIPSNVYSRSYLIIKENPLWNYDDRFKVIITTKEEEAKVKEFIQKVESEIEKDERSKSKEKVDESSIVPKELDGTTLCCLFTCSDPDDPVLSSTPLTLYFKDGSTYTSRICRDCVFESIRNSIFPYLNNKGTLEPDAVDYIIIKPKSISTFPSKSSDDGQEYWPQIPIGQLISLLINNDPKTSNAISMWLNLVEEYAIRSQFKGLFSFCPDHPHKIYRIAGEVSCEAPGCGNFYCGLCEQWHDSLYSCTGSNNDIKRCPKCKALTVKNGGCNHIECICGCHWCYICGEGFTTMQLCYDHLNQYHGGIFNEAELLGIVDDDDDYD